MTVQRYPLIVLIEIRLRHWLYVSPVSATMTCENKGRAKKVGRRFDAF